MNTTYKTQECDICKRVEFYDSKMIDTDNKFGMYMCEDCRSKSMTVVKRRRHSGVDNDYCPSKAARSETKTSPSLRSASATLGSVDTPATQSVDTSPTVGRPTAKLSPIPESAANTKTAFGKINQLNQHITYLKESINVLKASVDTLHANITLIKMNSAKEKQRADVQNALLENRVSLLEKFILQYMQLTYPIADPTPALPVSAETGILPVDIAPASITSTDIPARTSVDAIPARFEQPYEDKLVMQSDGVEFFPHDLWYHDNTCDYGLTVPMVDELPAFEMDLATTSTAGNNCTATDPGPSVSVNVAPSADNANTTTTSSNFDPREFLGDVADFLTVSESKEIIGTGRAIRVARRNIKKGHI